MGNLAAHGKSTEVHPVCLKVIDKAKEIFGKVFKVERASIVVTFTVATGIPGDGMEVF